jgi:hypothetical protein
MKGEMRNERGRMEDAWIPPVIYLENAFCAPRTGEPQAESFP